MNRGAVVVAEVHLVEVGLENLFLGVACFEHRGDSRFPQLSERCALGAQEEILGQLLGDGGATLRNPARLDVGHGRAADASEIQALMIKEALILHGKDRIDQVDRHFAEWHGYA